MQRRAWVTVVLAWLAFAASPAIAQIAANDLYPYTARELTPGVHLLAVPPDFSGDLPSNVVVIEQSDGLVLIDSGRHAADGRRVARFVRSISSLPVKALVITHWHTDHPGGASEIRAAWPNVRIISTMQTLADLLGPAQQYIGLTPDPRYDAIARESLEPFVAGLEERLRATDLDEATRQRYERVHRDALARLAEMPGTYLAPPTETFSSELLLDDPVRPVRLMFLGRANTDGDAIAWLPNERIVITGDVVVSPTPFGFSSYPADWLRVLDQLRALDYALLVPGHGEPQSDTVYVDGLIASINDIRAQVGPLARQGLTLEEVRTRVDYTRHLAMFGPTPRRQPSLDSFWLQPMTQNAYQEARGEEIVQGADAP